MYGKTENIEQNFVKQQDEKATSNGEKLNGGNFSLAAIARLRRYKRHISRDLPVTQPSSRFKSLWPTNNIASKSMSIISPPSSLSTKLHHNSPKFFMDQDLAFSDFGDFDDDRDEEIDDDDDDEDDDEDDDDDENDEDNDENHANDFYYNAKNNNMQNDNDIKSDILRDNLMKPNKYRNNNINNNDLYKQNQVHSSKNHLRKQPANIIRNNNENFNDYNHKIGAIKHHQQQQLTQAKKQRKNQCLCPPG